MTATKAMDIADDFTIVDACASWFYDSTSSFVIGAGGGVLFCVSSATANPGTESVPALHD